MSSAGRRRIDRSQVWFTEFPPANFQIKDNIQPPKAKRGTRGIKLGIFNRENCERGENSLFLLVIKLIDIDQFETKRKNRSETFSFFAVNSELSLLLPSLA